MELHESLRIILPAYFIAFLLFGMIIRPMIVAKKIGKNPVILSNDDSLHGLMSFYLKLMMIAIMLYAVVFALLPEKYDYFLPVAWLENEIVVYVGLAFLSVSFFVLVYSQWYMQKSFRIGIDENTKTDLVTTGIFSISRNPIYLSLDCALFGLFLVTPNAVTLIFFLMVFVLVQVQVRLEEDYLTKMHGEDFLNYKKKVRRFL